jgi:hypothetical protein
MRVGDFSVEIVATNGGGVRELDSGHVLARPGQVYSLRLRNHGPLRAVVDVCIDGRPVSGGGLVLDAWRVVDLERPIHDTERGRFTVIAEGDERVFGPDGGRDNPDLGLIEARFRRELPRPIVSAPLRAPFADRSRDARDVPPRGIRGSLDAFSALMAPTSPVEAPAAPPYVGDSIERAAGTGLTGNSDQDFVTVHVGPLESQATVIQLRLVIGTDEALRAARPLPDSSVAPARPAPRP